MEVRYLTDLNSYKKLSGSELRKSFLLEELFKPGKIISIYSDADRAITGSAVPVGSSLSLEGSKKEMASDFFHERRETGVINIGGSGTVIVDDKEFSLDHKDGLYIGRGSRKVEFLSSKNSEPAKFYYVSYPSHKEYPCALIKHSETESVTLGSDASANNRTLHKYIHLNGVKSSQLVMGLTELKNGSVWNTMPPHTHIRRSEIYLYFNMSRESAVIHLMGEPSETRHLVIRNEQAVISPPWSIHCGAGTGSYSFIWAMGGENQAFDDMDSVNMELLR